MSIITSPEETHWQPAGLHSGGEPRRNRQHYKASQQKRFMGDVKVVRKPLSKVGEHHIKQRYPEDHLCVLGFYLPQEAPLDPFSFLKTPKIIQEVYWTLPITFAKETDVESHLFICRTLVAKLNAFWGNNITRHKTIESVLHSGNEAENV